MMMDLGVWTFSGVPRHSEAPAGARMLAFGVFNPVHPVHPVSEIKSAQICVICG